MGADEDVPLLSYNLALAILWLFVVVETLAEPNRKRGLRHRATDFTLGTNGGRFGNRARVLRPREITGYFDVFPSVFENLDVLGGARSDTGNESGERGCDWRGRERGGAVWAAASSRCQRWA